MTDTLKADLSALRCEGNTAFLPQQPLKDYPTLKKTLIKATGKYKRNTFVFEHPAQEIIDQLLTGKTIDFKKETQSFFTPKSMADFMCAQIVGFMAPGVKALEPSAGDGALVSSLLGVRPNIEVTAVELNDLNFKKLKSNHPDVNLIHDNFLTHDFKGQTFDLILANPPFSKHQQIDHIYKMYDLLAPGGQLLTYTSTSWLYHSSQKAKDFRSWVEDVVYGQHRLNGQGAFKTSGTMVDTLLLEINK